MMSVSGGGQYPPTDGFEYRGDYPDWAAKGLRIRLVWRLRGVWKKRPRPYAEIRYSDVVSHFTLSELGDVCDEKGVIAETVFSEPTVFVAPVSVASPGSFAAEAFAGLPADAVVVYAPGHSPELGAVLAPSDLASLAAWVRSSPK
ncbi:MAG: hypothetical protein FWF75_06255 [Propionibacteriaceae bacterium]|nr:hypothetical protein [Propionibacteriaceae bacterium]